MLAPTSVSLLVLFFAAALLIAAAVSDARAFRIPNAVSLGLICLFPIHFYFFPQDPKNPLLWTDHVSTALIVLCCGFLLFSARLAGAGDIKLFTGLSLWAGPQHILVLLLTTGISGGLLSLIMICLVLLKRRNFSKKSTAASNAAPLEKPSLRKTPVPYGIAIALGGICLISLLLPTVLSS